jgi:hypothetical protein
VVTQVANDLKSGDLYIPEGDKFRDYRLQLLSWEEVEGELANYGEQAGAHLVLQTRSQVLDGRLEGTFQKWYLGFRPEPQQKGA